MGIRLKHIKFKPSKEEISFLKRNHIWIDRLSDGKDLYFVPVFYQISQEPNEIEVIRFKDLTKDLQEISRLLFY